MTLKLWMRIVGGFYLLLGLVNTPPLMAARLGLQYPALDLSPDHVAVQSILDLWFVFGVESAVLGGILLFAAAAPWRNKVLAQLVIVLELSRIVMDVYWISRGYYDVAPYFVWIIIHLLIILSGWRILQRAQPNSSAAQTEPQTLQPDH